MSTDEPKCTDGSPWTSRLQGQSLNQYNVKTSAVPILTTYYPPHPSLAPPPPQPPLFPKLLPPVPRQHSRKTHDSIFNQHCHKPNPIPRSIARNIKRALRRQSEDGANSLPLSPSLSPSTAIKFLVRRD